MKKFLLASLVILPISGCSWVASTFGDNPTQETKTTIVDVFHDSCETYVTALKVAASAEANGLLSADAVSKIDQAQVAGDKACKGPMPTNLTSAVVSVLSAAASITSASGSN